MNGKKAKLLRRQAEAQGRGAWRQYRYAKVARRQHGVFAKIIVLYPQCGRAIYQHLKGEYREGRRLNYGG